MSNHRQLHHSYFSTYSFRSTTAETGELRTRKYDFSQKLRRIDLRNFRHLRRIRTERREKKVVSRERKVVSFARNAD